MTKKRYKIYLDGDFNEGVVDTICELIEQSDFWYGSKYIKFHGTGEELEQFKRVLASYGIKIKDIK